MPPFSIPGTQGNTQAIWSVDSMGGYMDIAYARGHIYAFYEQYSHNSRMVEALVLKESEQTAL